MDAALPFRPQGTGALLAVQNIAPPAATNPGGPNAGDVCYLVYNAAPASVVVDMPDLGSMLWLASGWFELT